MYQQVRDKPHFVPDNYKEKFSEPCIPEDPEPDLEMSCEGTGISPENHPMRNRIWFGKCGNCESEKVLVIFAHWCVSGASGDAYWDYEIFCEECGKYTTRSFAEND